MTRIYALLMLVKCDSNTDNTTILLTRRTNVSFANGLYACPGGKVEDNETATDTIIREAEEELGIVIQKEDLSLVHTMHRNGTENPLILLFFTAHTWGGHLCNNEPDKCDDIQWFTVDHLPENIIPAHKQAMILTQQRIFYSEHGWQSTRQDTFRA